MNDPVLADEAANDLNETRSRQRWQDGKALRMEQAEELAMRALSKRNHSTGSEEHKVLDSLYESLSDLLAPLIEEYFDAKYSPIISEENRLRKLDARVQFIRLIEAHALKTAAEIVEHRL